MCVYVGQDVFSNLVYSLFPPCLIFSVNQYPDALINLTVTKKTALTLMQNNPAYHKS